MKKTNRGDLLKKALWTVCRFKRRLAKKELKGEGGAGLIPQGI